MLYSATGSIKLIFKGKTILLTGGTGSFGKAFTQRILNNYDIKKLIIYSRDELKQFEMKQYYENEDRIRFFIGDVRDKERLHRALNGVDVVIHSAALKQIPAAEYNPFEAVNTNIIGAQNIINTAIDNKVEKVVALSTDKAANPVNLYGATKLVSDKLFINGNYYATGGTKFCVVRYGNVVGSRGSVIPYFKELIEKGEKVLPVTHPDMTRFWITLDQGINLVIKALTLTKGREIFIPKIPSMKVTDLAKAIDTNCQIKIIGIRPGEKIHETLIPEEDARRTIQFEDYFIIQPDSHPFAPAYEPLDKDGKPLPEGFVYSSNLNDWWLKPEELKEMIYG